MDTVRQVFTKESRWPVTQGVYCVPPIDVRAVERRLVPYFGKIYEFSALLSHCIISRRRECIDKTTCFNLFIMSDVQFTGPHRHYWVVEMCSLVQGYEDH